MGKKKNERSWKIIRKVMFHVLDKADEKKKIFNPYISLPKFEDTWVNEKDINYILFLYYYIKSNQYAIDGHYQLRVYDFLLLLYSEKSIRSHWNNYKNNLNDWLLKLVGYKLINIPMPKNGSKDKKPEIISSKNQIINIPHYDLTKDFKDGFYTLFDYNVFVKITESDESNKPLLFYCTLFLLNRARKEIGITSYDDIAKVIGSKTTIYKYLKWLKENEIIDFYSTSHQLDDFGVPKRGNTFVAVWEKKDLIESIRENDKVTTSSKEYLEPFNEQFAEDKFFIKCHDMISKKYKMTNNFLLYRLWNELTYEFTWESIYKYLNAKKNVKYFTTDDDGEALTNKKKLVDKIVNVAKMQKQDVWQYIEDLNDHMLNDTLSEIPFVGRMFEENGYSIKVNKVTHIGLPKPKSFDLDEEIDNMTEEYWGKKSPDIFTDDKDDEDLLKYQNDYEDYDQELDEECNRLNEEQIPADARNSYVPATLEYLRHG